MEWKRQDKEGPVAHGIAYAAGLPAASVRNLVTSGEEHAIITWTSKRRVWEYWHRALGGDWALIKTADSAAGAKDAAAEKESEIVAVNAVRAMPSDTRLVVVAKWRHPYTGSRALRVRCSSPETGQLITGIFKRMGMATATEIDNSVDAAELAS